MPDVHDNTTQAKESLQCWGNVKVSPHGAVFWLRPLILHLPCAVWDDVRTCTRSFLWSTPGVCVLHDGSPRPQSHLRTGRTKCARTFCGHLPSIPAGRRIRKHCNLLRIRWHFGFIESSKWEIVKIYQQLFGFFLNSWALCQVFKHWFRNKLWAMSVLWLQYIVQHWYHQFWLFDRRHGWHTVLYVQFTRGDYFDKCGKRGSGWAVRYLICVPSKPLNVPCPGSDKHSCVCGSWQPPRPCLLVQLSEPEKQCRGFGTTLLQDDSICTNCPEGEEKWSKGKYSVIAFCS